MFLLQDSTTEATSHPANYVTDCVSNGVNSAFNACFKQGEVINDQ